MRRLLVLLFTAMLAGCTATPVQPAPTVSVVNDFEKLLVAIKAHHPDPWHGVDEATFTTSLRSLARDAASMHPDKRLVEVMRLMALLGRGGREGHTGMYPWTPNAPGTHVYPIQLWHFPDGLYVVDAQDPYRTLVGARVVRLAGHPIETITQAVRPLVPRENDQSYLSFGPMLHLQPEILHGLGLIPSAGPAQIEVRRGDGTSKTLTLQPIFSDGYRSWLGRSSLIPPPGLLNLRLQDEPLTLVWLASSRTALLRYREIRGDTNRVAGELNTLIASRKVDRVVLDLRWNGGGNNHTYPPILNAMLGPAVDRPGKLFVLTSRITFSAATNLATELDQRSSAIFVGEATGGSPNLYADTTDFRFASYGLTVRIPTTYWQKSTADDPRLAIEPDLPIPLTAADFFAGRDPVMDAVLATN